MPSHSTVYIIIHCTIHIIPGSVWYFASESFSIPNINMWPATKTNLCKCQKTDSTKILPCTSITRLMAHPSPRQNPIPRSWVPRVFFICISLNRLAGNRGIRNVIESCENSCGKVARKTKTVFKSYRGRQFRRSTGRWRPLVRRNNNTNTILI